MSGHRVVLCFGSCDAAVERVKFQPSDELPLVQPVPRSSPTRAWTAPLIQLLDYVIAGLLLACAVATGWILFFPI